MCSSSRGATRADERHQAGLAVQPARNLKGGCYRCAERGSLVAHRLRDRAVGCDVGEWAREIDRLCWLRGADEEHVTTLDIAEPQRLTGGCATSVARTGASEREPLGLVTHACEELHGSIGWSASRIDVTVGTVRVG
jgi:hypothetical protein